MANQYGIVIPVAILGFLIPSSECGEYIYMYVMWSNRKKGNWYLLRFKLSLQSNYCKYIGAFERTITKDDFQIKMCQEMYFKLRHAWNRKDISSSYEQEIVKNTKLYSGALFSLLCSFKPISEFYRNWLFSIRCKQRYISTTTWANSINFQF